MTREVYAYKKVPCEIRWLGDQQLKGVPFVFDLNGFPFEPLNAWVRENLNQWTKKGIRQQGGEAPARNFDQKVSRVVSFLNFLDANDRSWDEPTQDYLHLYVLMVEKKERAAETLNAITSAIFEFYWTRQKAGFCDRVIGINDVDQDDYRYPLNVHPSRNPKRDYDNPMTRRGKNRTSRTSITQNSDWEDALEKALDSGTAVGARDAVLISFILQTGARRLEAASLKTSDFEKAVGPSKNEMIINVDTKIYQSRDLIVPVEAYREVQDFIRDERHDLISNPRKDFGCVFCSTDKKNGAALTKSYISRRLKNIYGISPHDGRSTFATNEMIEHYRNGLDMDTAMLLVRERMGHSANDETARTLRQHYLQAKALVQAEEAGSKLDRARKEIAELKSVMAEKDRELDELRRLLAVTAPTR
ncbi:phage integrase family protein [Marinobacter nauticus]|uniref:Phage integrase family protein n=1 Tax=Marinobacter nauticus TaxID=2743 RepID=A0A368Y4V5_MARNT|nr:site-specific integrase [Marinobacter nauticus]RCW75222.1 phage integrase family protein [Marinobacter nauticus]